MILTVSRAFFGRRWLDIIGASIQRLELGRDFDHFEALLQMLVMQVVMNLRDSE
jgi:hypothetical protein